MTCSIIWLAKLVSARVIRRGSRKLARNVLCQDIVGHLSVEILEPDRELYDRFVRFLAHRKELA